MRLLRYPYDVEEFRALDQLFERRRSSRSFVDGDLSSTQFSTMLWAAQGFTSERRRTAPSAHALHPLTLSAVTNNVDDVDPGLYRYIPKHNAIETVEYGHFGDEVAAISIADEKWIRDAAAVLILSAEPDHLIREFYDDWPIGQRGLRYLWIEVGNVSQNIYLAAAAMNVGVTFVGGLDERRLSGHTVPFVPEGHELLGLLPIGALE